MQIITEQDNQRVAESFNAVISGLNHIAYDIKQSCADAVMDDDYEKVDASRASAMAIKNFVQELTELATRWNQGVFNAPVPEKMPQITSFNGVGVRRKNRKTRLLVTDVANNQQIQGRTAGATLVETLRRFEFEQVAALHKQVSGYPLVSKTKFNPEPNRYLKCGDWFVNFPSNTQYQKTFLDAISTTLKIPIRVDVV
ncbi:MAG: hypothetical protein EXR80_06455 [Methylococcales bacterium]|nr:hypothetical protein [Methylococcales bacterium]